MGGGCAARTPKPAGTVAVALDAAKKKGAISVPLANELRLTMPPAPPGHAWQIALHDTRYLKQLSEFLPPKNAGEGTLISFLAMNLGTTRLRFLLAPQAGQSGVDPVDQYELQVRIQ